MFILTFIFYHDPITPDVLTIVFCKEKRRYINPIFNITFERLKQWSIEITNEYFIIIKPRAEKLSNLSYKNTCILSDGEQICVIPNLGNNPGGVQGPDGKMGLAIGVTAGTFEPISYEALVFLLERKQK